MHEQGDVRLRRMIVYAMGWLGFSFFWPFNMTRVPLYLNSVLELAGVSDQRVLGLLLGMLGLFGMTIPFLAGSISDRLSSRFGRRRPLIIAAFPLFAASLIAMFALPSLWQKTASLAVVYMSAYFMQTPYQALMPEVVSPRRRGTANGLVNLITMIGTITYLGMGTALWNLRIPRSGRPGGVLIALARATGQPGTAGVSVGPLLTAGLILALFVAGIAALVFGVHEGDSTAAAAAEKAVRVPFLQAMKGSPDYLWYLAAAFLMWLGFGMIGPYFTLYATRVLKLTEKTAFLVLAGMAVGAAIGAVPAGIVGDRYGRKRAIIISVLVLSVCLSLGYFITRVEQSFAMMAVGGIGFAFISVLPYAMSLDLMPAGRTGQFIGINNFCTALSNLVGPVLGGFVAQSRLGYRGIFLSGGFLLFVSALLYRKIRERPIRLRLQEY